MTQTEDDFHDPRTELTFDLEIGQTFERRGELWTLVYLDEDIVVLRSPEGTYERGSYRIGKQRVRHEDRDYFEAKCGAGEFEITDEDTADGPLVRLKNLAEQYEADGGRKGSHKAEALQEALEVFSSDGRTDDNEKVDLENIDGIGETAAQNLRHAGYVTKGDFRSADDEELLDVGWVGETGVSNIRKEVK